MQQSKRDLTMIYITLAALFMASLGTSAGWFLYNRPASSSVSSEGSSQQVDESLFAEEADAEGVLKKGGSENDGTHRLERSEGDDVYLLSTVLDLDSFAGKSVKIWGNTLSSQEVEWLMDVGRVKILK